MMEKRRQLHFTAVGAKLVASTVAELICGQSMSVQKEEVKSSILIAGDEVEESLAHNEHLTSACRMNESANAPTACAERSVETE